MRVALIINPKLHIMPSLEDGDESESDDSESESDDSQSGNE